MSVSKIQSQAEVRETLSQMAEMKRRAARQAARDLSNLSDTPPVECTILPQGDSKVSMGEHFDGIGDAHFEEGETALLPLPIAIGLYDKGYVNFEGAKAAAESLREERREALRQQREAERRAREDADAA